MSTILEDKKDNEDSSGMSVRREWKEVAPTARIASKSAELSGIEVDQIGEYRVVFVVNDSRIDKKAFDFALQAAHKFSSPLVLVYLSQPEEIPADYLEFAHLEGIRDYEWQYYNWLAGEKLGQLGKKAEADGVEWFAEVQVGEQQNIIRSFAGDKRTLLVLNPSLERKFGNRMNSLLLRGERAEPVPVLVY